MERVGRAIFGYSKKDVLGHSCFEMLLPKNLAFGQLVDVAKDALEARAGSQDTNENLAKSGQAIMCEWHNTILASSNGTPIGLACIFQDVTNQKKLEISLRQAKDAAVAAATTKSISYRR